MKKKIKLLVVFIIGLFFSYLGFSQNPIVRIDNNTRFQKITGFGGFVNSPQFGYNHMSTNEIQKVWGANSVAGYNIMRLYIPENKSNWSSVLPTAQLAKSMGLTIFASPWTMPAEWKTNNHINAVYVDANGVEQIGYLKPEHYMDYALYLDDFVTYLKNNGIELDYISVQNEPDEKALYHGCIWTPDQIATFVKDYGHLINCKVIAPESVGFSDNYANAFLKPEVMANFEVYGGHQYGGIQSVYKQFQNFNKEIWQTEYLINWNSSSGTGPRDFDWSIDGFTLAKSINDALLGNINAWIHYATKRFYGLMGDGTNGSIDGEITKRGRILQQFAKNVTGKTRINATWSDEGALKGSTYISTDGNKIVLFVYNPATTATTLKVDLPFYTNSGTKTITNSVQDYTTTNLTYNAQTFRPSVTVDPLSVITFVFDKSAERPVSNMIAENIHYNKIDIQQTTNTSFGTAYKISGLTKTWSASNPLFSLNTTVSNGYVALDDRYTKLIMNVKSATSAGSRYSDNTTLYYVNALGTVSNKNYGRVTFPTTGSFDIVLDLSTATLTDGIKGIIGLTNSNYSSVLTMNFGDVYLNIGNEKAAKFSGVYSEGDSNLMDALESNYYTSLDFETVTSISSNLDLKQLAVNKNCIYYLPSGATNLFSNGIVNNVASSLSLVDQSGDFNVPFNFSANSATYTGTFTGYRTLTLPFEALIPTGVTAYTMVSSSTNVICTSIKNGIIPANTPVLISANGTFTFNGSGVISTPKNLLVNSFVPVYIGYKSPVKSYVLKTIDNVTNFYAVTTASVSDLNPFTAYITSENNYSATSIPLKFDTVDDTDADGVPNNIDLCPNTPSGQSVDSNGCLIIGANNFAIEVSGETCPDKNNGQIKITATQNLTYSATVNGVSKTFTDKTLSLINLTPNTYDICINIAEGNIKQCYSIVVPESTAITAKTTSVSDKLEVDIQSGTAPYQVNVNGVFQFETNSSNFTVDVNNGDVLEVTTSKPCEGTFAKTITLYDLVKAVPNPTVGPFDVYLSTNDTSAVIEIYTVGGALISKALYPIENGKVHLDLEKQPAGIYFVKVQSNPVQIVKVIKK